MNRKLSNTSIVVITIVISSILRVVMYLFTPLTWCSPILGIQLNYLGSTLFYYLVLGISLLIYFLTRERGNPCTPLMHLLMIATTPIWFYVLFFFEYNSLLLKWLVMLMIAYDLLDFYYMIGIYPRVGKMKDNKLFYIKLYTRKGIWKVVKNLVIFMACGAIFTMITNVFEWSPENEVILSEPVMMAVNVEKVTVPFSTAEEAWESRKELLQSLCSEEAVTWDLEQRVEVLQDFTNLLCGVLELEPCRLVLMDFDCSVGGYYLDNGRFITIDRTIAEKYNLFFVTSFVLERVYYAYIIDTMEEYDALLEAGGSVEEIRYRNCEYWEQEVKNYRMCKEPEDFLNFYTCLSHSMRGSALEFVKSWVDIMWENIIVK